MSNEHQRAWMLILYTFGIIWTFWASELHLHLTQVKPDDCMWTLIDNKIAGTWMNLRFRVHFGVRSVPPSVQCHKSQDVTRCHEVSQDVTSPSAFRHPLTPLWPLRSHSRPWLPTAYRGLSWTWKPRSKSLWRSLITWSGKTQSESDTADMREGLSGLVRIRLEFAWWIFGLSRLSLACHWSHPAWRRPSWWLEDTTSISWHCFSSNSLTQELLGCR